MSDLVLSIVVICLFLVFLSAAIAGMKAAPYVPTFQRDVRRMLKIAGVRPHELVVDLGAGDGRFLITAAREFQADCLGYELSVLPFLIAQLRVWLSGVRGNVRIMLSDFFHADLSTAHVITCFLTPMAMKKLEPKFLTELRPGTRIVSYAFKLPTLEPTLVDRSEPKSGPVFLYVIPQKG